MKVSSIVMEVLDSGIILELHIELSLLMAMMIYAVMRYYLARVQVKQRSEDPLKRPDSHDKYVEHTPSLSDETANRGRRAGMKRTKYHQLCMIMDEVMEVRSPFEVHPKVEEMLKKRAAEHNLRLFDEFCHLLDMYALTVVEIARVTKHSTTDFYKTLVQNCVKVNINNKVAEILTHMAKHNIPRNASFGVDVLKHLGGVRWFKEALHIYPILTSDGLKPSAPSGPENPRRRPLWTTGARWAQ